MHALTPGEAGETRRRWCWRRNLLATLVAAERGTSASSTVTAIHVALNSHAATQSECGRVGCSRLPHRRVTGPEDIWLRSAQLHQLVSWKSSLRKSIEDANQKISACQ